MRKNLIKKTLAAAIACFTALVSIAQVQTYAAETSKDGIISITATATNKDKEAQKNIEFSLYQVASNGTGEYGYVLPSAVKNVGVTAKDFAGSKEVSEIAKTLDTAYASNGVKADQVVTTNDNGKAEFTDLATGIYLIRQTTSEDTFKSLGHRYTTDAFLVEITNINKEVVCQPKGIVKDIPSENGGAVSTGAVAIIKVDEDTGAYLAGAKFTLYKSSGEKVTSCTTNEKGWADIKPLEYGDYYFIEDEAPEGYIKETDKISFTLDQEHSYSPDYPWNIKVTNKKATTATADDTASNGATPADDSTSSTGTGVGGFINTGDYSNVAILCIVGGASLVAACALVSRKKKNH